MLIKISTKRQVHNIQNLLYMIKSLTFVSTRGIKPENVLVISVISSRLLTYKLTPASNWIHTIRIMIREKYTLE